MNEILTVSYFSEYLKRFVLYIKFNDTRLRKLLNTKYQVYPPTDLRTTEN